MELLLPVRQRQCQSTADWLKQVLRKRAGMCLKCLKEGGQDDWKVDPHLEQTSYELEYCSFIANDNDRQKGKKNRKRGGKKPALRHIAKKPSHQYQVHAYSVFYENHVHFRPLPSSSQTTFMYASSEMLRHDSANAVVVVILPNFNQSILEYISLVKHLCDCGATVYGLEQRNYGTNYHDDEQATAEMTLHNYISDYLEIVDTIIGQGKCVKVFACGIGCLVALNGNALSVDAMYLYEPIGYDSRAIYRLFNGPLAVEITASLAQVSSFRNLCNKLVGSLNSSSPTSECAAVLECDRRYLLRNSKRTLLSRQLYNDYTDSFAYRTISNAYFEELVTQLQLPSPTRSSSETRGLLVIAVDSRDGRAASLPASLIGRCTVVYKDRDKSALRDLPADSPSHFDVSQFLLNNDSITLRSTL